jgi:hypothetical protein
MISCRNEQVRHDARDVRALEKIVNAALLKHGFDRLFDDIAAHD